MCHCLPRSSLESCAGEVLARRGVGEEVEVRNLVPINLADVSVVAVCPLRVEGIVCLDGILVNLCPSYEFVVEGREVSLQSVECEALTIVSAKCGKYSYLHRSKGFVSLVTAYFSRYSFQVTASAAMLSRLR